MISAATPFPRNGGVKNLQKMVGKLLYSAQIMGNTKCNWIVKNRNLDPIMMYDA